MATPVPPSSPSTLLASGYDGADSKISAVSHNFADCTGARGDEYSSPGSWGQQLFRRPTSWCLQLIPVLTPSSAGKCSYSGYGARSNGEDNWAFWNSLSVQNPHTTDGEGTASWVPDGGSSRRIAF